MKNLALRLVSLVLVSTFAFLPATNAASQSKIDAYYKKIYRQLVSSNNTDAITAITYYDVEIKQAIGKVLDGRVKCDSRSKNAYKTKAFDPNSSEVDQVIFGFYLGYCNAK